MRFTKKIIQSILAILVAMHLCVMAFAAGYRFEVDKVDKLPPAVQDVALTGWGVTVTATLTGTDAAATATDGQAGVTQYAVTEVNSAPTSGWQSTSSFTIIGNGTYFAWVKDGAGNVSASKEFIVDRVDTIAPVITGVLVPDTWGRAVTVTVQAKDDESSVVAYAVTTANSAPTDGWQSADTFALDANGIYYAWAKDAAGNISGTAPVKP